MSQNDKFHQVNLHVDNDAALIFQHALVRNGIPLTIRSGANQITWGYSLLTQVTPTYGGEVQQILGARIEELEINGQTRDNDQLEQIYQFFRAYMTMASGFGANNDDGSRSEIPMVFSYPARGWQFKIQVIDASGFQLGTTLVATPWSIKAIIVPTGEEFPHILEKETMNDMTAVLMPEGGIPVGVGYNAHNQYSDAAYSGSQVTNAVLGQTIGDNFQRLLGAYSTGDFSHFAFEGAAPSAYNSLNQSAKDAYTSIFGSDVISNLSQQPGGQVTGASGATGGTSYTQGQTTYPDPTGKQFNDPADGPPQLQIVAWLASNAIKMGIPPLLPIMAAITESHLCNLDRAHSDPDPTTSSEGFFQQQHQFYDALIPGYATKPDLQVQAFLTKILAKKSEFPGATNEATQNAENLGDWIQSVQLSGPNDYHKNYDKAKQLLNQSSVAVASGSGASAVGLPTQGSVRAKAVQNAQWMLAHTSQISYSQSGQRVYLTPPALPFSSDCSGSCISAYNWAIATTPGTTAVAQSDGYTGTMLSRLTHITADQASPGDMVVVGSGTGHHAIMLLNKVGNDWNCFSHGGPAGPHTTPLSYYAARDTITYLRWPGDIDKAN